MKIIKMPIGYKLEGGIGARAYLGTQMNNLADDTWIKVLLDTINWDLEENFDVVNNKFVAPVSGYYQVNASIGIGGTQANRRYLAGINKNGSPTTRVSGHASNTAYFGVSISDIVYMVKGDSLELWVYCDTVGSTSDVRQGLSVTFMSVFLLWAI